MAILALVAVSHATAGMIHVQPDTNGAVPNVGASNHQNNHAAKKSKQGSKSSKAPKVAKQSKSGKHSKGTGSDNNGGGSVGNDTGTGNAGSESGGTFNPLPDPDPPIDMGLPEIISPPGEGTLNTDFGGGLQFVDGLGNPPGENPGVDLPLLLTVGTEDIADVPPILFLEFNPPGGPLSLSPFDANAPELTDLDPPQHNPEPSSIILAALGGACTVGARLHRHRRRQDERD
jgi:hypothetical protein